MTNRENQIYQWIVENPMISQEELADRAGITRSSVAVHISNLIKKGYIRGRGYVTCAPGHYVVVGAVNIDISGKPDKELNERDSNPGEIITSFGGVGRNIAHNMRLMGLPVQLITAFGDDNYGKQLVEHLNMLGIDTSASLYHKYMPTSTYLYITDKEGDMKAAVSDMKIYDFITPNFIADRMNFINLASAIVVDTNIPEETLRYIAENATIPIFADTVSCIKAKKLLPILNKIHTITPNELEAEILTGVTIKSDDDLVRAADILLEKGVRRIFITLGADGVFCADGKEKFKLPAIPGNLVNTTGAGDAFMAGLSFAYERGFSLKRTALCGLAASSVAIETDETINSAMSEAVVSKRAGLNECFDDNKINDNDEVEDEHELF